MRCSVSKELLRKDHQNKKMCTDIVWLFVLIAFLGSIIAIAVFSIINRNYLAVINGYDSYGNICGVRNSKRYGNFSLSGTDTSKKPYVLFFDSWNLQLGMKLCIEKCVEQGAHYGEELYEQSNKQKTQFCRYDFDQQNLIKYPERFDYLSRLGPCPTVELRRSIPVRRRCIPIERKASLREMYLTINSASGVVQLVFVYVYFTWPYIVTLSGVAFVISIAFVIMIQWSTNIIPWVTCFLVFMGNAGLCAKLWSISKGWEDFFELLGAYVNELLEDLILNEKAVYILARLSSITTVVLFIVIIQLRKERSKATLVLKEAASCLIKLPGLMTIPAIALLMLTAFVGIWSYIMLCMTTATYTEIQPFVELSDHEKKRESIFVKNLRTREKVEFVAAKSIRNLLWIYMFGLIWITEFIFACEQFVLSAAVSHWYFKRSISSPTIHGMGLLLKHHFGTAAKGAFIITLFKFPRLIITWLCKNNPHLKRFNCKYESLENWIEIINHRAYAVVAMERIEFCSAGRMAWNFMANNTEQLKTSNKYADIYLFIAKLAVANLTGFIGLVVLKGRDDIYFYTAPVIFSMVFAFYIAHVILSMFEITADTLILCVCKARQTNAIGSHWADCQLSKFFDNDKADAREVIQVI